MFVELENIDLTKIKFFIVGTGPASYCVAKKLEEKKISCLMIEAGDIEYSDESQEYYEGETEGNNAIISLSGSRLRQYGGTSGHWSGLCRTLDSYDFKNWTIDKEELTPYEKQTLQILNFKTKFFEKSFLILLLTLYIVSPTTCIPYYKSLYIVGYILWIT